MENEITLEDLVDFLAQVPGFGSLARQEMEELLAPIISIAIFEAGQVIIQRGSIGRSVFFLYKGQARVDIRVGGGEDKHFYIDEGEMFGEVALVSQEKRGADVVAVVRTICLTIDIETFQTVMTNHWHITKAVASLIGTRRVERLTSMVG